MLILSQLFIYMVICSYGASVECKPYKLGPLEHYPLQYTNSNELFKISSLQNLEFTLPNLIMSNFKLLERFETPKPPVSFQFLWRQNIMSPINNQQRSKKLQTYEEVEKTEPDCSDIITLSCDEQKQLIKEIFGDLRHTGDANANIQNIDKTSDTIDMNDQIIKNSTEQTTVESDLETTTFDFDETLNRMAPPHVVAALLG